MLLLDSAEQADSAERAGVENLSFPLFARLREKFCVSALGLSLALILALRLLTLEFPALTDPTEGRYALIGQNMFLGGDWVVPKLPIDGTIQPYLGKPPLQFWAIASAFSVFGMDEWTARLPSFLALLVIVFCVTQFCKQVLDRRIGIEASLILVSMVLIYFFSGAVTIDITLSACVAAALTAFAIGSIGNSSRRIIWGLGFFVALAVGFLTKGPIVLALAAVPILTQLYAERSFRLLGWLPWTGGISLFLLLVLPWFLAAEISNPGFSRYFFVNENLLRFFASHYGDRYGSGHRHAFGSIWWMFSVAMMPWTPLVAYGVYRSRSKFTSFRVRTSLDSSDRWRLFLLAWMISPAMIFTFARQIHPGYVLPGLPAGAILMALMLDESALTNCSKINRSIAPCVLLARVAAGLAAVGLVVGLSGFAPSEMFGALLLTCLCCIGLLLRPTKSITTWRKALAFVSVALVVTYNGALSVSADEIGEASSAEAILNCISVKSTQREPVVAVTGNSNFSPLFYSQAWEGELQRQVSVKFFPDLKSIGKEKLPADLLLKLDRKSSAIEGLPNHYKMIDAAGRWAWLHDSRYPLNAENCETE